MSSNATGKRRYDATNRRQQAATTRHRVVEAAAALFVERGYTATTVPAIALAAGVAVETVYRAASGKAGLLTAAVRAALAGGAARADTPVLDRDGIRRVTAEADPRRQLAAYVRTVPGVWSRVGPLLRVLESAASTDPELEHLRSELEQQRLDGMTRFAATLQSLGALKPGLPTAQAADILWTLCAQSVFHDLVETRGWSHRDYATWLTGALGAALLRDPRPV